MKPFTKSFSIAPMMDCTDRHARYFLRLIAPHITLYTEMITAQAIIYGKADYLLAYDVSEHPLVLQLGGSDPTLLAEAAKIGEAKGYQEINLNAGCPSPRVSKGRFGACLMLEPLHVAECIAAMKNSLSIPVTIKCRIGVDHQDDYASLQHFIKTVASAGCQTFIIHARKAWLAGLSPKQNREIPPLRYEIVHQIKQDFPELKIIINGGIKTLADIDAQLPFVDGIMIGREAYANPYFLAAIEQQYFPKHPILTRSKIVEKLLPYIKQQLQQGTPLTRITRHLFGLFQGEPGARMWRRHLSESAHQGGFEVLEQGLALVVSHGYAE